MYELLLLAAMSQPIEREVHYFDPQGGVPMGVPCTPEQQKDCLDNHCTPNQQPGENLTAATCEQTAWWGTPGGDGYDCGCKFRQNTVPEPCPRPYNPRLEV